MESSFMFESRRLADFESEVIDIRAEHTRITHGPLLPIVARRTFHNTPLVESVFDPFRHVSRESFAKRESILDHKDVLYSNEKNTKKERYYYDIANEVHAERTSLHPDEEIVLRGISRILSPANRQVTNLERAKKHLNANYQAYIAMALAEAFADGVEIDLDYERMAVNIQPMSASRDMSIIERQNTGPETSGELG
jgi:hypothetical protein